VPRYAEVWFRGRRDSLFDLQPDKGQESGSGVRRGRAKVRGQGVEKRGQGSGVEKNFG